MEGNWQIYEAYLAHFVVSYPSSLSTICEIISTYRCIEYNISTNMWRKIAMDSIRIHAPLRHDSEVCWAMWLLWEIEAIIEDAAKVEIERMNNGIVATMALLLQDKSRFRGSIDTRFWEETAGHRAFHGELWLLAYEGSKRGWLPIKGKDLDATNIANLLHEQNVSFLDERAKLEPIFEKMPRIKVGAMEEGEDRLEVEIEGYEYVFSPRYEKYG